MHWQFRLILNFIAILTVEMHSLKPADAFDCPSGIRERVANAGKGQLFAAAPSCLSANCIVALEDGSSLPKGRSYVFYATADASPVRNSVVGVQIKNIADTPRAANVGRARVALSRERVEFACKRKVLSRGFNIEPKEAFPLFGDRDEVSYSSYDSYHRWGPAASPDHTLMTEKFHVRYHNGGDCVASNDPKRRPLLLIHDLSDIPGGWATLWHSIGGDAVGERFFGSAYAGAPSEEANDLTHYSQFKVRLVTYSKGVGGAGCFSFPVNTQGLRQVQVTLRDLEALQYDPEEARTARRTWRFQVQ